MNKGLEQFNKLKTWYILKMVEGNEFLLRNSEKEMLDIIEKELTLLQDLLGHVTDLYKKKELDYYADRDAFYYNYYIVFDNIPLKVSEELYEQVRKQLDLPNKCKDW